MTIDNFVDSGDLLERPYWSLDDVISIVMDAQYKEPLAVDDSARAKTEVICDLTEAILSREIVPVDLETTDLFSDYIDKYLEPFRGLGYVLVMASLLSMIYYLSNRADLKESLARDGFDFLRMMMGVIKLFGWCALIGIVLGPLANLARILFLKCRSNSPAGRLRYVMEDAKLRGFTKRLYDRASVIQFFRSSYELDILGIYLGETGDEGDLGRAKSEKMAKIAKARHSPRQEAKEKIIEYLKREIQDPCCCYHSQMVRYIEKIADKQDGEISLKFKDGAITTDVLRALVKNVYKMIDDTRIQDKNVVLPDCPRHGRN
jgi:hypothetical protein